MNLFGERFDCFGAFGSFVGPELGEEPPLCLQSVAAAFGRDRTVCETVSVGTAVPEPLVWLKSAGATFVAGELGDGGELEEGVGQASTWGFAAGKSSKRSWPTRRSAGGTGGQCPEARAACHASDDFSGARAEFSES